MAAWAVAKCGPVYAAGTEPGGLVVPVAAGVGWLVASASRLADIDGAGLLAVVAGAAARRSPVPETLAWRGAMEAHADTRMIRPAAPASGMARLRQAWPAAWGRGAG